MVMELAEEAVNLHWLAPCAASLVALATEPCAAVWPRVRSDPGGVLLLVRHALPQLKKLPASPVFHEIDALEAANRHLQFILTAKSDLNGFVDWDQPGIRTIYQSSLLYARLAHHLAGKINGCDADLAWMGGQLAPLGWLALAVVDPEQTLACLEDCRSAEQPAVLQRQFLGLDYAAIARRLNQKWHLPAWLATITGHLALTCDIAVSLGAEPQLFQVVQLAVALVEERRLGLRLACGNSPAHLCHRLGLDSYQVERWAEEVIVASLQAEVPFRWEAPSDHAVLPDLLALGVKHRRVQDNRSGASLQQQIDALQEAVMQQGPGQDDTLKEQKLTALAEFAAGAAHEINNPLAVISGQAQLLLGRETELDRREILQKVIKQTQRIHSILTEVMQFARPAAPKKQTLAVRTLIRDVTNTLQELAAERKINLVCPEPAEAITLYVDADQITKALGVLLRNGIEAAPEGGWAGIRVKVPSPDVVHFVVEDNGRGPNPAQRDMLFDPFFSGRTAGRGRGLGLPVAWRLARQHEGDIFWDETSDGPTRFVLRLPFPPPAVNNFHSNGVPEMNYPPAVAG